MYLIIKKSDFGSAGFNYAVAGHDNDRSNAIRKILALDTLNDDKKTHSFQLWSSENGYLNLDTEPTKTNGAEQEAGQVHE